MLLNGQKTGMGKILSVTTTDFFSLLSFYTIFIYSLVNQLHIFKEKKKKKNSSSTEIEFEGILMSSEQKSKSGQSNLENNLQNAKFFIIQKRKAYQIKVDDVPTRC